MQPGIARGSHIADGCYQAGGKGTRKVEKVATEFAGSLALSAAFESGNMQWVARILHAADGLEFVVSDTRQLRPQGHMSPQQVAGLPA